MEAQSQAIQVFDLHKTKLLLNKDRPRHDMLLGGEKSPDPSQKDCPPNLIEVSFSLTINETLN